MKKINSIFKTIVVVAIVLVIAQGCVPAGGNTPTSGTFNVGIDDEYFLYTEPHINFSTKILEIDGDSICFAIMKADNFHIQRYFGIYTKSSDGNVYEFLSYEILI
ncbi:MAG: hypothetical protein IPL21_18925 [Saprospirales bacterium]|nr:hypothetical protein [Saprospirales bacterium]